MRDVSPSSGVTSLAAQFLSVFFQDKVAKVRAATVLCSPPNFTGPCQSRFEEFSVCTIEDIRNVIVQSLQKSCTLDPLPHQCLMTSMNLVLPLLHIICNRFLCEGTVRNLHM